MKNSKCLYVLILDEFKMHCGAYWDEQKARVAARLYEKNNDLKSGSISIYEIPDFYIS